MAFRLELFWSSLLLVLILSASGSPHGNCQSYPNSTDILIWQEANHLWNTYRNEVWQFFNPDDIPILLFHSSNKQWLLNHPNPPDTLIKLTIAEQIIYGKKPKSKPLWYYFSATIWPFNKHWTAILPSHSAWQDFCKEHELPISLFSPDQLVFISLHEQFHAFQMRWLEDHHKKILGITDFSSPPTKKHGVLTNVPIDTPIASFCIREQAALYQAYMEEDLLKTKPYISDFLNLREQKAKLVSVRERELEDYMELIEGTTKYIELRLSELLPNGYQAIDAIRKHPQFNDYKDVILSPHQSIQKAKTGELTSDRVCTTGTIMCTLLDRVFINDWKKGLFKNYHEQKVTLCYLLKERYSNVGFGAHNEEEQ